MQSCVIKFFERIKIYELHQPLMIFTTLKIQLQFYSFWVEIFHLKQN
jgi:hypothetical protein